MVGTRISRRFGIGTAVFGLTLLGSMGAFAQETVTLRMVGSWAPEVSPYAEVGHKFAELAGELSDGRLKIEYVGASEVVPTFDQPEALVNGVFDVWYGAPNYWAGIVPGGYVTELSKFQTPDGGPGSELYEFMVDMYGKHGVRYLGHAAGDIGEGAHYLSSQKEIKGIDDLKSMKVRVPPLTRYFVQAAGAESVTLPPSDVFLAVDRGTVDGFTWPIADGYTNYGWQTVTKYLVNQPMYRSGTGLAMNLDKWNELPEDMQKVVLDAVAQTQEWTRGWFEEKQDEQEAKMKEAGMGFLELSAEESERWTDLAQESLWEYFATIIPQDEFAQAETLLERQK
jgi:TRAP-type transport system periplasmic protein